MPTPNDNEGDPYAPGCPVRNALFDLPMKEAPPGPYRFEVTTPLPRCVITEVAEDRDVYRSVSPMENAAPGVERYEAWREKTSKEDGTT